MPNENEPVAPYPNPAVPRFVTAEPVKTTFPVTAVPVDHSVATSIARTRSGSGNGEALLASCVRMPARPVSSVADTLPVVSCREYSARSRAATPLTSGVTVSPSSTTSGSTAVLDPTDTDGVDGSATSAPAAVTLLDGLNTTYPPLAVTAPAVPNTEKLFTPTGASIRTG